MLINITCVSIYIYIPSALLGVKKINNNQGREKGMMDGHARRGGYVTRCNEPVVHLACVTERSAPGGGRLVATAGETPSVTLEEGATRPERQTFGAYLASPAGERITTDESCACACACEYAGKYMAGLMDSWSPLSFCFLADLFLGKKKEFFQMICG